MKLPGWQGRWEALGSSTNWAGHCSGVAFSSTAPATRAGAGAGGEGCEAMVESEVLTAGTTSGVEVGRSKGFIR